jgi:hypothetical protein
MTAQLKGSRNRKESAKVGSGLRVNSENREWDFVVVNESRTASQPPHNWCKVRQN